MSLRARLALLYTLIVGGILLLFGTAVYAAVSVTLTRQIDDTLVGVAQKIINTISLNSVGGIDVKISRPMDYSADVYIQLWGKDGRLLATSDNARGIVQSLDGAALSSTQTVFHDITLNKQRLRVLTVPLTASSRFIGSLQLGTRLTMLDAAQNVLLIILISGAVVSMLVAGLAGLFSTREALFPLEAVTQTALQITRADDLSRRIPYSGSPDDEVGQLINAFNLTLSRLENLFHSQRRFLADVGHELRTPLTVIRGNVDLMRRMDCTDDESMDSIQNEVDRLTRLVGDLLLLAQAESGKLPIAHRTVELDTLLLNVMHEMRVLAHDRKMKLGEIDQVLVCGDSDRLKQVVVNLIGNAIKYTPKGGEILVGLGKVENQARLTVSDDGPGIPVEDLPHIFERFYRGEKSRTRSKDGKGFGLGLSIAYWIVRNHGGQIDVSLREPHGTTFCIWLPLVTGKCEDDPNS
jgi:two-component system OmpR family sensor kinase